MRNPYKKVTVEWVDASTNAGWEDLEIVLKERPHPVTTTGYLVHEDEECVVIATTMSYDKDGKCWTVNGWFCIPSPWVVRMKGYR